MTNDTPDDTDAAASYLRKVSAICTEESKRLGLFGNTEQPEDSAYVTALMKILERATKVGFTLQVTFGQFFVIHAGTSKYSNVPIILSPTYDPDSAGSLLKLEKLVKEAEDELEEHHRQLQLRESGLAKLSDDEREALGLSRRDGCY